jgi:hypothetical protein
LLDLALSGITALWVQFAYSLNVIHEALGDAVFAERAEQLTYNALPGALTKVSRALV